MGAPIEINKGMEVMQELVSCASSLNMTLLEEEASSATTDTYITDLQWGKHAYEHLVNVMKFLSREDVKIVIENKE